MLGRGVTGEEPRQCCLDQAGELCTLRIYKVLLTCNPMALEVDFVSGTLALLCCQSVSFKGNRSVLW